MDRDEFISLVMNSPREALINLHDRLAVLEDALAPATEQPVEQPAA